MMSGGSIGAVIAPVLMIWLANTGAILLAFNQDIAPTRVGMVAGIMGCIGSLMGALLVWFSGAAGAAGARIEWVAVP